MELLFLDQILRCTLCLLTSNLMDHDVLLDLSPSNRGHLDDDRTPQFPKHINTQKSPRRKGWEVRYLGRSIILDNSRNIKPRLKLIPNFSSHPIPTRHPHKM